MITADSGEDGALFNVLPAYASLLASLEQAKKKHAKFTNLATSINLAWSKLDEYYQNTDDSKVYFVASVLDPRVKLRYFEKTWKKSWLTGARAKLDKYVEEFITAMGIGTNRLDHEMDYSQTVETTFGSWREADDDRNEVDNEWDRYLGAGRVKDFVRFSLRQWWIAHRGEFPILSQIALELLAVPAMLMEVERVFSGYVR